MSRKAQSGGPNHFVIGLIIAVVIFLLFSHFIGRSGGLFGDTTSSVGDEIELGACNVGGIFSSEFDCDADGVRDKCDPCIDGSSSADTDGDGMPDACETASAKDDKSTIECRWESEDVTITLGKEIHVCSIGPEDDNDGAFTLRAEDCPNGELAFDEISFTRPD